MDRTQAGTAANEARITKSLTWAEIAQALDAPLLWTISAVLGQHPMTAEQAATVGGLLDLAPEVAEQLTRQPTRGAGEFALPTDPTLYRLYEALMVYGPAIKEVIHEDFGDGIMSAINFRIDARKVEDEAGDRVVITLDGKFLPYQW